MWKFELSQKYNLSNVGDFQKFAYDVVFSKRNQKMCRRTYINYWILTAFYITVLIYIWSVIICVFFVHSMWFLILFWFTFCLQVIFESTTSCYWYPHFKLLFFGIRHNAPCSSYCISKVDIYYICSLYFSDLQKKFDTLYEDIFNNKIYAEAKLIWHNLTPGLRVYYNFIITKDYYELAKAKCNMDQKEAALLAMSVLELRVYDNNDKHWFMSNNIEYTTTVPAKRNMNKLKLVFFIFASIDKIFLIMSFVLTIMTIYL